MKYKSSVRNKMPAWEKLSNAYAERREREDHFRGITWREIAEDFKKLQPPGAKPLANNTILQWGKPNSSGFDEGRQHLMELVLDLPEGWLGNGKDDAVPSPSGRRSSTILVKNNSSFLPKRVYLGGTAKMWTLTEEHSDVFEVRLLPDQIDDTFVKVQDGTLNPEVSPSEIICFSPAGEPEEDGLHLVQSLAHPETHSIRFYDGVGHTFVDPEGLIEALPASEWKVVGLATSRYRAKGLKFKRRK